MNFVMREGANLIGRNLGYSDSPSIERSELDHEAFAAFVSMDDCADVAYSEAVLRQVNSQCHAIEFSNHARKG